MINNYRIITDSTSDLPVEIREAFDIDVIPMNIHINGTTYADGNDIQAQELFSIVNQTGEYPKTSAPSVGDFISFFKKNGRSIYISVSSKLSSTYNNACLAARETGEGLIDVIDSASISTGYGQVILKALRWKAEGMRFEEAGFKIRQLIKKARGIFILDRLDYLYHGGRCGVVQHFVSSILKIRPFLNIRPEGTLGVLQKVRGSRRKALSALFSFFQDNLSKINLERIIITHLGCEDEVEILSEMIQSLSKSIGIMTANVGCVLASHSGPKPLGIAYIEK